MAVSLVSLTDAKAHLRVDFTDDDDLISLKIADASDIVIDFLKKQPDPPWDETTVPGHVRAAVLLVLGNLYGQRGDNTAEANPLTEPVISLLWRSRDPALA